MYIKRGKLKLTAINKLSILNLISNIGMAAVGTIWAIYLESILKKPSYVGSLITFFTIISLTAFIFLIPLIERQSKSRLYMISLALYLVSYILFGVLSHVYAVVILGAFMAIIVSLRMDTFGIMVSDKSKDGKISANEGLIYTFLNLSWMIGPLVAGYTTSLFGVRSVFIVAAIFIFLTLILFKSFDIRDNRKRKRTNQNVIKIFIDFFRNKHRVVNYILSGGINFWWVLVYVYLPLMILEAEADGRIIGYALFAIVVPLVLLEYPFGLLAEKIGFKKIFFTGYLILAVIGTSAFFVNNIFIIILLLTTASIGAAMIESTTEAYFFSIVPKKNQRDKYYGPYNTTVEIHHAIASFIGGLILLIFPFKFLFLFFGAIMLLMVILSLKVKEMIDIKNEEIEGSLE